jgi:hypothetical protein
MNADGSNPVNLTNAPGDDGVPAWSPDGQRIAFSSNRDGDFEVYAMNADGSNQVRLTTAPGDDLRPNWSPDGLRIAFDSQRDGSDFPEIYVMDADGSNQTRLTNNPAGDEQAVWSPDGTLIAFRTLRDGNCEIYTITAAGANPTNLTNNPACETEPNWEAAAEVSTVAKTYYLVGASLLLDTTTPTAPTPRTKDSTGIKFQNGNAWVTVGTWTASASSTNGTLLSLDGSHVWLGLKNTDDIGTRADVRVEVRKNGSALVGAGETYCVQGLTRNASSAKDVPVTFPTTTATAFNGSSDQLSMKVLVRIGTNGSGVFCGGHASATGIRLYFDASSAASQFSATFQP